MLPSPGRLWTARAPSSASSDALKPTFTTLLLLCAIAVFGAQLVPAKLTWNYPASGSVVNGCSGFRVHYGNASRAYQNSFNVNFSSADGSPVITKASLGWDGVSPLFVAVTAFDNNGIESDYSNEIQLK